MGRILCIKHSRHTYFINLVTTRQKTTKMYLLRYKRFVDEELDFCNLCWLVKLYYYLLRINTKSLTHPSFYLSWIASRCCQFSYKMWSILWATAENSKVKQILWWLNFSLGCFTLYRIFTPLALLTCKMQSWFFRMLITIIMLIVIKFLYWLILHIIRNLSAQFTLFTFICLAIVILLVLLVLIFVVWNLILFSCRYSLIMMVIISLAYVFMVRIRSFLFCCKMCLVIFIFFVVSRQFHILNL